MGGGDDVVARARSPNRDKALEIWLEHKGDITNRELALMLDEKEKTISNWKSRDKWNVVLQTGERSTTKKNENKAGAPAGNKNAKGNRGGAAPRGNTNAVTHGLFAKYLPEETLNIMDDVNSMSPIDILWMNIKMQFASIMRAQQIMHVTDKDELIKHLKKHKEGDTFEEKEWEFQFAWDRQASFLNSQSRAMGELRSMLKQFTEMAHEDDHRALEAERMKAVINKTKAETEKIANDDNSKAPPAITIVDAWSDDDE